ncbi:MAG: LysM peptidoglycan-binding domain-containing protein [Chloroflexi bacterium]|nr:LysM peptidoglycan-binding domain-containing protein [Chloroflexota bacterium]
MNANRQLTAGLILASLAFVLTLGGILAATAESGSRPQVPPATPSPTQTPAPAGQAATPTATVSGQTAPPAAATLLPSRTPAAPAGVCPIPPGWQVIVVGGGENLASLALKYQTTPDALAAGNCLLVPAVSAGSLLYVPNLPPSATFTPVPQTPCGPPASWVRYTIRTGDTLYSLGRAFGVSVAQLQFANCLGASTYIRAGDLLWVPNVATITPTRTITPTPTRTFMPSATPTRTQTSPPSSTPSATSTATDTPSPTVSPTYTFTPDPSVVSP